MRVYIYKESKFTRKPGEFFSYRALFGLKRKKKKKKNFLR